MNEMISEKGMARQMMSDVLSLRRNSTVTSTTKKIASMRACFRFLMLLRMVVELSMFTAIFTSAGSRLSIFLSRIFTSLITSTVFLPVCFCRIMIMAFLPSPRPYICSSS